MIYLAVFPMIFPFISPDPSSKLKGFERNTFDNFSGTTCSFQEKVVLFVMKKSNTNKFIKYLAIYA